MSGVNRSVNKAVKYAKPSAKLLNSRIKQEQEIRSERNKLALASVKDIFQIFNPNAGSDEDFDLTDFDCKVYFANPKAFEKLPFFKQQHVIDEMNEKLKKNWKKLDKDIKRFSVWWAYGSHGPRDGFVELHDYYTPYGIESNEGVGPEKSTNIKPHKVTEFDKIIDEIADETAGESSVSSKSALHISNSALDSLQINKRPDVPVDLPFKLPSILKTFRPTKDTVVHKLPTLDPRSFGLKRLQQYKQDRMMNPVNKIVLLFLAFLTVICFKQDRRVNVTGVVPEYPWEVAEREEKEEQERLEREKLEMEEAAKVEAAKQSLEQQRKSKKWYYLWLK